MEDKIFNLLHELYAGHELNQLAHSVCICLTDNKGDSILESMAELIQQHPKINQETILFMVLGAEMMEEYKTREYWKQRGKTQKENQQHENSNNHN